MAGMENTFVDFEKLEQNLPQWRDAYRAGAPFPHIVLDDVLRPEAFEQAVKEFPATGDEFWRGYLHLNETKYSNTEPDTWGSSLRGIAEDFCSPRFVKFLEDLTGIEGMMADWSMDGGGLHQTLRGGHLNIHADFSSHHTHENWARRVNILLYLNEEWHDDWGGKLELWNKDMTRCEGKVTPQGNRMLVFTTTLDSFHGHPDGLTCPEGEARRSMALYYFTEEDQAVRRSTNYQPRPQDSGVRTAMIKAERGLLDGYDRAKRRFGISDDAAQKVMAKVNKLRKKS